jgi:hypothetical protein
LINRFKDKIFLGLGFLLFIAAALKGCFNPKLTGFLSLAAKK